MIGQAVKAEIDRLSKNTQSRIDRLKLKVHRNPWPFIAGAAVVFLIIGVSV